MSQSPSSTGPQRTVSRLSLIGLAVALAFGCAGNIAGAETLTQNEETTSPPVETISVWTHDAPTTLEFTVLKRAAETFNRQQNEYKIEIFPSFYRNYEERVQHAADTGTLPCLLELDGPFLHAFAWPGYLQPIDKFVPPELLKDLLPSVIAQGTYEGRLYSVGQFDSGLALWGNRRHLAAAGVRIPTMKAPWTLAEFEQALARLTALDEVDYALSLNLYALGSAEFYPYAYAPIVQGFGGDLIDRQSYRSAKGVLDGPQAVTAMKHFQSWFKKGWTQPVFNRVDDFEKGKASLSWGGHWKYLGYRDALGDELVLLPLPDFGQGIKTGMGSWSWGISSTCRHPAGAWAFLSYLMSTEAILRITNINGAVPARYSAMAQSPLYHAGGPLTVFAEQLSTGCGVPRPATPAYGTIRKEFSAAVTAIVGGSDPQIELSKAARNIDEDILSHRGYPFR